MKKLFFTGLITMLPLAFTLLVVVVVINLLTIPFQGLAENILTHFDIENTPILFLTGKQVLSICSKIMAIALLFGIIVLIGFLGRLVFLRSFMNFAAKVIRRIPLVNKVYKIVQDAVQAIFGGKGTTFTQAVFVPYPHEDVYSIGLIAKKQTPEEHDDEVSVFVPGTPNPTAGYMLSYKFENIILTDMKVDEAVKFIVSCGLMSPFNP